jgi:soluble lytic murein transglycosylase
MERVTQMSSKVLLLALALTGATAATAQINEATRSLYTARLADNAAGRFDGMAGSPLVGVANVPTLDSLVTWDRLRRDSYTAAKGARFAEYAQFLRANPDWPQGTTVRRLAEKLIDDSVTAPERLAYFSQFPPLSALAKLRLAEAQLSLGKPGEARASARDAWDSAGLDPVAEQQLLTLFEKDLRPEDHLSRADRLLWSNQTSAAARLLPRIDMDRRLWLLARLALRADSPDAANRLAGVPPQLRNDPGLILDRAAWLRRKGLLTEAQTLLANASPAPGPIIDGESWLKTRLEFARTAWRTGNFDTAYRIASRHGALSGGAPIAVRSLGERQQFIDSEWLAGWLALRKLGRADAAIGHFRNVRTAALTPLSQTRGDYWIGRAAEAAGQAAAARTAFEAAAGHFDYFYGQLAAERLGRTPAIRRIAPAAISADMAGTFRADPLVRASFALGDIGDRRRQALFVRSLADRAQSPRDQALVAGLVKPLGRPDLGVLLGKAARSNGQPALIETAFPMLALPASLDASWTMIHAIARQESQFDQTITSSANAQGLMQLLPTTAAEQAAKLGLPASTARLTTDPIYNVTLGSGFFRRLQDNFGGSHVLAVAAYNAGPGNVRKFLAANGDPRLPGTDMIDWIEAIPFSETRNYVQRVLENAVVYDLLHPETAVMPRANPLSAYLGKTEPG